jgi:HEAT repeat protein
MTRPVSLLAFFVSMFACRFVAAGGVSTTPAIAHAGGGQAALAVGFDANGALRARVCPSEPCSIDGALAISVPSEASRLATGARLRVVRLGAERKAVVVEIPDPTAGRTWSAIVAAPLKGNEALVPFNGYTGLVEGVEGERSGPALLVRDEGVYVGVMREDRDLCGRPALLSPRVLDPATLTLRSAKLQRLPESERAAAPRLVAVRKDDATPSSLVRAAWATSAADGAPASALTDGNAETAWAEGRGGAGRGEAVVMRAPREVPILAFQIALPATPDQSVGATPTARTSVPSTPLSRPRELWLGTDHELFHVTFPDDKERGTAEYQVLLPSPVRTSCVALVIESAVSDHSEVKVGVAELRAEPALGGTLDELVHRISTSGPEADAAAAILRSRGRDGFVAVAAAFDGFAEEGRRAALDVLDDAPCDVALPVYAAALAGTFEGQRDHARSALPRCGAEGPVAIARAIGQGSSAVRVALADELSTLAPGAAVDAMVPLLATAREKERRAYRVAIERAARSGEGRDALRRALAQSGQGSFVTLELLRAPGAALVVIGDVARRAFARLATDDAPFRTRFLLLGPAAELSEEDGAARAFLRRALTADKSPYVRAEAARALRSSRPFYAELSRAADDSDVRVREAAVLSLGAGRIDEAADRLVYRLGHDSWPLVRGAAARSLRALGPSRSVDAALTAAITEEESPDVRRIAVLAVGARRVTAAAPVVRERFQDKKEIDSVRAAAALSLGMMCDAASADALTDQALHLVSPTADEAERRVAESALAALGFLHPVDLARRIARLSAKSTPSPMRRLAASALASKGRCSGVPVAPAGRGATR